MRRYRFDVRRSFGVTVIAMMMWASPGIAQRGNREPIEIPLRMEEGRLMVTAQGPDGATHEFVVGLGMTFITETGASRLGSALSDLTLQGVPVQTDGAQTVPDAYLTTNGPVPTGVIGGETFNSYDLLIDLPNGRLILKPVGRSVRWDGVTLSSAARTMRRLE